MTGPSDDPMPRRSSSPANRSGDRFARRRGVALLMVAGAAAVLAITARWWLPTIPPLLGLVEANSEIIGTLADFADLLMFIIGAVAFALGYFGLKKLRTADGEGEAPPAVRVDQEGRGAAVGGDVYRGIGSSLAITIGSRSRSPETSPTSTETSRLLRWTRALLKGHAGGSESSHWRRCPAGPRRRLAPLWPYAPILTSSTGRSSSGSLRPTSRQATPPR
jgi:hypothetical protein